MSLEVEISYKLQIENWAKQFRGSGEAPCHDRPPFSSHLYASYFPLFWTTLESTKSKRRIVFTQSVATADSQTAGGKEQPPLCSSGSHMEQSGRSGGTRTNSCTPTCSIKDDWNESLLPMAGVFYSKLGFMFRADVADRWFTARKKNVCFTFPPNKFKPVYRISGTIKSKKKLIKSYDTGEGNPLRLSITKSMIERRWHRRAENIPWLIEYAKLEQLDCPCGSKRICVWRVMYIVTVM